MFTYVTYILLCKNNRLYTGSTRNLQHRFQQHQNGNGAKFTKYNPPIKIVHIEPFPTRSLAMKRERAIKKLSRKSKENLIGDKLWIINTQKNF